CATGLLKLESVRTGYMEDHYRIHNDVRLTVGIQCCAVLAEWYASLYRHAGSGPGNHDARASWHVSVACAKKQLRPAARYCLATDAESGSASGSRNLLRSRIFRRREWYGGLPFRAPKVHF